MCKKTQGRRRGREAVSIQFPPPKSVGVRAPVQHVDRGGSARDSWYLCVACLRPRGPRCRRLVERQGIRASRRRLLVPRHTCRGEKMCFRLRPPRLSEVCKNSVLLSAAKASARTDAVAAPPRRRPGVAPDRRRRRDETRIKPRSLGARLRGQGPHELGLLVGRLEAAVAELRGRVDELEVDLLHLHAREVRV